MTAYDDIKPSESGTWERVKVSTKSVADYDAAAAQASRAATAPLGTPSNPSSAIFTLANAITACRFLLTLIFLYLFVNHADRNFALTLYAIAAITDFLDGWIARATQTVSWLGKIMDPLMDRALLFTGVVGLVARGELPLWVAIFVIGRDLVLLVGSIRLQKYRRRPVDVSFIGKVSTALLMTGFCFCLLNKPWLEGFGIVDASWLPLLNHTGGSIGLLFVYVGVVCSTITAVRYYREGFAIKRRILEGEES